MTAPSTDEQRLVAALAPDVRCLVLAGPGTGKTHTLLLRANALADEHDHALPGEVLVLSFTNAVVDELRRRSRELRAVGGALLAETFDAFARRLLRECSDETDWQDLDFDGKVQAATALIVAGDTDEPLGDVRHILVDETQDLVDVRADMVLALLARHGSGFTAFGDPAQAIYDWGDEHGDDLVPFDKQLAGVFPELCVAELTVDHRTRSDVARIAHEQGRALRRRPANDRAQPALRRIMDSLDSMGDPEQSAAHLACSSQSTAVLCRDNATVLLVARAFAARDVTYSVRRSARDRPIPPWVALIAGAASRTQLPRDRLEAIACELGESGLEVPEPRTAWRQLSRLGSVDDRVVSLDRLSRRLAAGGWPLSFNEPQPSDVTLSTVHRAKGLEYEIVVIVEWPERPDESKLSDARLLFVALTRARDDIWHMTAPTVYPWRVDRSIGRWVKAHANPRYRGRTYGIELRTDDVDERQPPGAIVHVEDPRAVHRRLRQEIQPCDPVDLRLLFVRSGNPAEPVYGIYHEAGFLGITGPTLGRAVARRISGERFPAAIRDVVVEGVETVAGLPEESRAADLGPSGLWLRPRVVGLGEFTWGENEAA